MNNLNFPASSSSGPVPSMVASMGGYPLATHKIVQVPFQWSRVVCKEKGLVYYITPSGHVLRCQSDAHTYMQTRTNCKCFFGNLKYEDVFDFTTDVSSYPFKSRPVGDPTQCEQWVETFPNDLLRGQILLALDYLADQEVHNFDELFRLVNGIMAPNHPTIIKWLDNAFEWDTIRVIKDGRMFVQEFSETQMIHLTYELSTARELDSLKKEICSVNPSTLRLSSNCDFSGIGAPLGPAVFSPPPPNANTPICSPVKSPIVSPITPPSQRSSLVSPISSPTHPSTSFNSEYQSPIAVPDRPIASHFTGTVTSSVPASLANFNHIPIVNNNNTPVKAANSRRKAASTNKGSKAKVSNAHISPIHPTGPIASSPQAPAMQPNSVSPSMVAKGQAGVQMIHLNIPTASSVSSGNQPGGPPPTSLGTLNLAIPAHLFSQLNLLPNANAQISAATASGSVSLNLNKEQLTKLLSSISPVVLNQSIVPNGQPPRQTPQQSPQKTPPRIPPQLLQQQSPPQVLLPHLSQQLPVQQPPMNVPKSNGKRRNAKQPPFPEEEVKPPRKPRASYTRKPKGSGKAVNMLISPRANIAQAIQLPQPSAPLPQPPPPASSETVVEWTKNRELTPTISKVLAEVLDRPQLTKQQDSGHLRLPRFDSLKAGYTSLEHPLPSSLPSTSKKSQTDSAISLDGLRNLKFVHIVAPEITPSNYDGQQPSSQTNTQLTQQQQAATSSNLHNYRQFGQQQEVVEYSIDDHISPPLPNEQTSQLPPPEVYSHPPTLQPYEMVHDPLEAMKLDHATSLLSLASNVPIQAPREGGNDNYSVCDNLSCPPTKLPTTPEKGNQNGTGTISDLSTQMMATSLPDTACEESRSESDEQQVISEPPPPLHLISSEEVFEDDIRPMMATMDELQVVEKPIVEPQAIEVVEPTEEQTDAVAIHMDEQPASIDDDDPPMEAQTTPTQQVAGESPVNDEVVEEPVDNLIDNEMERVEREHELDISPTVEQKCDDIDEEIAMDVDKTVNTSTSIPLAEQEQEDIAEPEVNEGTQAVPNVETHGEDIKKTPQMISFDVESMSIDAAFVESATSTFGLCQTVEPPSPVNSAYIVHSAEGEAIIEDPEEILNLEEPSINEQVEEVSVNERDSSLNEDLPNEETTYEDVLMQSPDNESEHLPIQKESPKRKDRDNQENFENSNASKSSARRSSRRGKPSPDPVDMSISEKEDDLSSFIEADESTPPSENSVETLVNGHIVSQVGISSPPISPVAMEKASQENESATEMDDEIADHFMDNFGDKETIMNENTTEEMETVPNERPTSPEPTMEGEEEESGAEVEEVEFEYIPSDEEENINEVHLDDSYVSDNSILHLEDSDVEHEIDDEVFVDGRYVIVRPDEEHNQYDFHHDALEDEEEEVAPLEMNNSSPPMDDGRMDPNVDDEDTGDSDGIVFVRRTEPSPASVPQAIDLDSSTSSSVISINSSSSESNADNGTARPATPVEQHEQPSRTLRRSRRRFRAAAEGNEESSSSSTAHESGSNSHSTYQSVASSRSSRRRHNSPRSRDESTSEDRDSNRESKQNEIFVKRMQRLKKELEFQGRPSKENSSEEEKDRLSPVLPPVERVFNAGDLVWGQRGDSRYWPGKLVLTCGGSKGDGKPLSSDVKVRNIGWWALLNSLYSLMASFVGNGSMVWPKH